MATVKPPECKKNKKEAKMHFTLLMAGPGRPRHIQTPPK